jgi:hypothetical protein
MNRFVQRTWQPPDESVQLVQAASTRLPAADLLAGDHIDLEGERLTVASVRSTERLVFLSFAQLDHVLYVPRKALVRVIHLQESRTLTIQLRRV